MTMVDLDQVPYHPAVEQIAEILTNKTQNTDRRFFRIIACYFLAKMASSMRAVIHTNFAPEKPVNVYAVALATSGFGKGYSVNILEGQLLNGFRKRFMEDTFPVIADQFMWKMAIDRATMTGKTEDEEKQILDKEFNTAGALAFTFDSATPAAVKQLRHKLLLAQCGSINLQIDEIGSNLMGATDVLNLFLELYDQGMVKQKLTKNTNENVRSEEIEGKTPTNALLFGTPAKLLDGGQTEDHFYTFLDIGYARRCLFGWGERKKDDERRKLTAAERYAALTASQNLQSISTWASHFTRLADPAKHGWTVTVDDTVGEAIVAYQAACENKALEMAEHEEIRKAEMEHRYDKAMKLAGTLAFVDESSEITMDHWLMAIKLVEESGEAFEKVMTREKTYVKLAKYIAACGGTELTHADLDEALPFYKSGNAARNEMMTLARAWGYKQHIIIKKRFVEDGIEVFSGETLEETDLNRMILSYSDHFAYNYEAERAPFEELYRLTQADGLHWANHHFKNGHRAEENAQPGFNMITLDIDGGISLETVHDLLKDFRFMTYTTKRHSDEENRFRLIMPINYVLELDQEDYREFMDNVMEWLPFQSDQSANQRAKKWESFSGGSYHYNDAPLLDALRFIPRTTKNEAHRQSMQGLQSLDNLERWFAQRVSSGNRNNQLIKYALALVDSGMSFPEIEEAVLSFNNRLPNGLSVDEIRSTILVTVAKKLHDIP